MCPLSVSNTYFESIWSLERRVYPLRSLALRKHPERLSKSTPAVVTDMEQSNTTTTTTTKTTEARDRFDRWARGVGRGRHPCRDGGAVTSGDPVSGAKNRSMNRRWRVLGSESCKLLFCRYVRVLSKDKKDMSLGFTRERIRRVSCVYRRSPTRHRQRRPV